MHKEIYIVGQKLPKREKLGIHAGVEMFCIEILALAIEAAFKSHKQKIPILEQLRVKIEVLKHIVRTEHECSILDERKYLRLSEQLVIISKETTNWIVYTHKGA
ncbi:MAG: four helix bundle protein [bacterium]|nr:four helix bundle protein [bacterium]